MEEVVLKYGMSGGPLMLFFLGIGYAAWKWGPPVASSILNTIKEIVAALESSTAALNNSTQALAANTNAMEKHHEAANKINEMWEEMKGRMDNFQCPHTPPTPPKIALVQSTKKAQAVG